MSSQIHPATICKNSKQITWLIESKKIEKTYLIYYSQLKPGCFNAFVFYPPASEASREVANLTDFLAGNNYNDLPHLLGGTKFAAQISPLLNYKYFKCWFFFFNFGPPKESIFLTTFYGLYQPYARVPNTFWNYIFVFKFEQSSYLFSLKNSRACRDLIRRPPRYQADMLPIELSWLR